jgi:hypothetical protein
MGLVTGAQGSHGQVNLVSKKNERWLLQLYEGDLGRMEQDIADITEEPRIMNKWADNMLRKDVRVNAGGVVFEGPGPMSKAMAWGDGAEKDLISEPRILRTLAICYLTYAIEHSEANGVQEGRSWA